MAAQSFNIEITFQPQNSDIDFLTKKINEESKSLNIEQEAYAFGIFMRDASNKDTGNESIIGGCNGSVIYGSIYTDQLWVDPRFRGKGYGKVLMEKVHDLGKKHSCTSSTVGTMSFQGALEFYLHLGYAVEFEREGYANGSKMIYLKRLL